MPIFKAMAGKREVIDSGSDKRYVRRDQNGRFADVDNVSASPANERKGHPKSTIKGGYVSKKAAASAKAKTDRKEGKILGRSSATGKFIWTPATKSALEQERTVRAVEVARSRNK